MRTDSSAAAATVSEPQDQDKVGQVATRLMGDLKAGRWPVGARLPGERALAEEFGVSYITLRHAVADLVARGRLRRLHGSGTYVSSDAAAPTVGLATVFRPYASPFIPMLLERLRARHREHGLKFWNYLFLDDGKTEGQPQFEELLEDIRQQRIRALIVEPVFDRDTLFELHRSSVPVVILAGTAYPLHTVHLDLNRSMRDTVRVLAEGGCRRLVFLDPYFGMRRNPCLPWLANAASSFQAACHAAGLAGRVAALEEQAMESLLAELPDGLILGEDVTGKRVIDRLFMAGVHPGRDLTVAVQSNAGSPVLRPYEELLIRMEFDPARIAESLMDLALTASEAPRLPALRRKVCGTVRCGNLAWPNR